MKLSFPAEEYEEITIPAQQQLVWPPPIERTGFTVVEWGGSELDQPA